VPTRLDYKIRDFPPVPNIKPGERYTCTSPGEASCNIRGYFQSREYRGEVCIAAGKCLWLKKVEG
jgi:hypothetical protein